MKKVGFLCLFICIGLCYQPIQPISMDSYTSDVKTIEIKGAVQNPGVYEVAWSATIQDVIQEAGGLLENAETSSINLSKDIENEGVIVIAEKQEKACISINTATLEELDSLTGIGPSLAQRIIDYRNDSTFSNIEDLMEVKGIKEKLFEKIKGSICL